MVMIQLQSSLLNMVLVFAVVWSLILECVSGLDAPRLAQKRLARARNVRVVKGVRLNRAFEMRRAANLRKLGLAGDPSGGTLEEAKRKLKKKMLEEKKEKEEKQKAEEAEKGQANAEGEGEETDGGAEEQKEKKKEKKLWIDKLAEKAVPKLDKVANLDVMSSDKNPLNMLAKKLEGVLGTKPSENQEKKQHALDKLASWMQKPGNNPLDPLSSKMSGFLGEEGGQRGSFFPWCFICLIF